jgi:hypothetical protein
MSHDPYRPPRSKVEDARRPPGSPIVAIVVGLITDVGGTIIASIVIGIVYASILGARGLGSAEIESALTNMTDEPALFALGLAVGLGFSVLGGYVCGRIARRNEYRLAGIQAALGVVITSAFGDSSTELGIEAALTVLSVAGVLGGAHLARMQTLALAERIRPR